MASGEGGVKLEVVSAATWGVGIITSTMLIMRLMVLDRFYGVMPFLLLGVANRCMCWIGRATVLACLGLISSIVSFVVLLFFLSLSITVMQALYFILSAFLLLFSACAVAACIGVLSFCFRDVALIAYIAGFVLPIASGIIAPLSVFWSPLQYLFSLLPLSHGLQAVRYLSQFQFAEFHVELLWTLGLSVVWLSIAIFAYEYICYLARTSGIYDKLY